MPYPASLTLGCVNPILNSSPTIVATAISNLPAAPSYLSLGAVGVNSAASGSLLNPVQGINGNSAARAENQIPTALLALHSEVLTMAGATLYRL
jgi:hypothetical protein